MGYYTYLDAQTEHDGPVELLVAKNDLPFFWLSLLDEQALAAGEKWWHYQAQLAATDENELERFQDILPSPARCWVSQDRLRQNAARTGRFLQQHQPGLLPLYQELVRYPQAQLPGPDDTLSCNLGSLPLATGVAAYAADLRRQLAALDANSVEAPGSLPSNPSLLTGQTLRVSHPDPAEYPLVERGRSAAAQSSCGRAYSGRRVVAPVAGAAG